MIDKIRIYKEIKLDVSKFDKKFKYEKGIKESKIDYETGEILKDGYTIDGYSYSNNGLFIFYSNNTKKLWVKGRLPNISTIRNLVHNLDDYIVGQEKLIKYDVINKELDINEFCIKSYYDSDDNLVYPEQYEEVEEREYARENLDSILNKVNEKLYELTSVKLDISEFTVSNIEICFNIFEIENVDKYIELFNLIFKHKNDKRYINFVLEQDKTLSSSLYIKSKSNFKNNTNNSCTINFYNKLDQLENLEKNPKNNSKVTPKDKELAKNVLRLEVQLGYRELKKTSKVFKEFLDIDFCAKILIDKYKYFISKNENLDFYCYKRAKEIISNTDLLNEKDKKSLLKHIQNKHKCNKKSSPETEKKYNNMLQKLTIHHYFMPTSWGIDFMESPAKLLKDKVEYIKEVFEDIDDIEMAIRNRTV